MTDVERPGWLPMAEFPFESRLADVGGNTIHYIDEGKGPALLFVHAGPAWSFVFRDVIVSLRHRFRCVALDFPGSGLSIASPEYRPGLSTASEVLEAFMIDRELEPVTLVAHDLGGPVALGVAARQPARFRAIAVTESFGWALSDEHPKVARMLRLVGGRAIGVVNDATNVMARGMSTSFGVGKHLTGVGRRAFRGPYRDRRVRRNALAMLREAATANEYLRGVDDALRTKLRDLPLLLVYGSKSPTLKSGFPDAWRARVPSARLVVIEGGHHFPQMDEPTEVAGSINDWWNECVSSRPGARTEHS